MSISEQSNAEINLLRRNSLPAQRCRLESSADTCRVCGDGNAKMHYGVVTCFGCKGFFRRTLKRPTEYQCRHNGTCVVDRHERNSCRYCRFRKCIQVGMDPKAVRPDRDATGRHYQGRQRRSKLGEQEDAGEVDSEWMRKLPVDMRTTLMQLMNIDLVVGSGDGGSIDAKNLYPLPFECIRQVLEDPSVLDGKRTEMRYDSFREVEAHELPSIAHRRLIAAIDWVDHLFDMMDIQGLDDKIMLVKHGFAPLMVFTYSVATAKCKQTDVISLCNCGYVKRDCCQRWSDPYHFANKLADRSIDELITPFRRMCVKEEEVALLQAIIILNPHLKGLSIEAAEAVADLRDRIQETLYHVVRETHPKEVASSRFGNLLLFVPSVMMLGNIVVENLTFVDSFGTMTDRMMHDLLKEEPTKDTISAESALSLSMRRHSEPRMAHSASSSSVDSLGSGGDGIEYQNGGPSMTYNLSSNSLPAAVSQFDVALNSASSMPNLEQMNDCDPDYNVTLTPDMFSDMRQAMSVAHNMDAVAPELPQRQMSPVSPTVDRPTFYIESTKHKFAVTPFDNYANYPPPVTVNGMPPQGHGSYSQNTLPAPQQPLMKTNSLPPQYYNNYDNGQYNQQPMDYEETYYQ